MQIIFLYTLDSAGDPKLYFRIRATFQEIMALEMFYSYFHCERIVPYSFSGIIPRRVMIFMLHSVISTVGSESEPSDMDEELIATDFEHKSNPLVSILLIYSRISGPTVNSRKIDVSDLVLSAKATYLAVMRCG